mmetsp:Transcript_18346/g.29520  ORF Transcript_18346/g.29520 Transcript_18346/m.29520 type:complete len:117 (+) Transcript_18346:820-1170(+)
MAKAAEMGKPMAISVCDESGNLKAFRRMDGAALMASEIAMNKAKTANGFGMPTHGWYDFIKEDGPLALGAPHIRDIVVYGGGFPIVVDDAPVGAIGVSGGHYTEDMQVAEAGLAAI